MRVAVTGATGIVGRFVVAELLRQGCRVNGLHRDTSDLSGFKPGVHWLQGDLSEPESLTRLLDNTDALVHCALEHAPGAYRGGEGTDPLAFWRRNLSGSINLLEAARHCCTPRVVLLSSRAVFAGRPTGVDPATPVDDNDSRRPDSHYGSLKVALETLGAQYAQAYGICISSIRPTGVYGITWPLQRSKWLDYARSAVNGRPIETSRSATEVHGDDLAGAIWLLLNTPVARVKGLMFNCSDSVISSRQLAAELGCRASSTAPLPATGPAPLNRLRCSGLEALGWRAGGSAKLATTLDELIKIARGLD